MSIFYRPHYNSDTTEFLNSLKQQNPAVAARQREGRSLLWDKTVDRQAWQQYRAAKVPQQPYVYQTAPSE